MIDGIIESKMISSGTSLVVQWLRLHTANIGGLGLIPGQRTRSHMPQPNKQMKKLISSESKILNQSNTFGFRQIAVFSWFKFILL